MIDTANTLSPLSIEKVLTVPRMKDGVDVGSSPGGEEQFITYPRPIIPPKTCFSAMDNSYGPACFLAGIDK